MNLLYNHECYDQVLDVGDTFTEKHFEVTGDKYPYACATLAVAACHKLVSLPDDFTTQISLLLQRRRLMFRVCQ